LGTGFFLLASILLHSSSALAAAGFSSKKTRFILAQQQRGRRIWLDPAGAAFGLAVPKPTGIGVHHSERTTLRQTETLLRLQPLVNVLK